jgi:radial spoke head protein 9
MKLELALMKLTETTDFDQILFWGKIEGIKKDYYIAQGLNFKGCYEFPMKTFYWCSGADFNFAKFTEVKSEFRDDVDKFRGMFVGQPDKILIAAKQEEVAE